MAATRRTTGLGWRGGVLLGTLVLACEAAPVEGALEQASPREEDPAPPRTAEPLRVGEGPVHESQGAEGRPLALLGPAVTSGGRDALVAWWDVRDGGVYGQRVRADGSSPEPMGMRLNPTTRPGGAPAVADAGHSFVVVWEATDGVAGARLDRSGAQVQPFSVITSHQVVGIPALACGRDVCLVVFMLKDEVGASLGFVRVSPRTGEVLDPEPNPLSGARLSGEPAVAWNGREFLVAWTDSRGGLEAPDIYGARVRPDGIVMEDGGFPIGAAPGAQRNPKVTWTGRRFLVVWEDQRHGSDWDIYGARVERQGQVVDPEGIAIATGPEDQRFPSVAHQKSRSLVVWQDGASRGRRIRGARLTTRGVVRDAEGLWLSENEHRDEYRPVVGACGRGRFLVPYAAFSEVDEVFAPHLILARRVTPDARVLDASPLVLTRGPSR
ncbi:hypothetical protein DRW03_31730 [Corallococcus sp. H22C18031201]|nr:hypothetical protein DRW03_31730 [Corallococcus sp. H22C18031201]